VGSSSTRSATHGNWSIEFQWARDRWLHVVRHSNADYASEFRSVEGEPNADSPLSPVFQELQVEQPEPGVTEFQAFGRCGRTVCSAAIRISNAGVLFDVCMRNQSAAAPTCRLSTYDLSVASRDSSSPRNGQRSAATLSSAFLADEIDSRCAAPEIVCEERPNAGPRCFIAAQGPQIAPQNRTVRWRYRIGVREA
jgi:hypothetical protein